MYFKNIKPNTTCLYSAASIFLRSLSADLKSFCSKVLVSVLAIYILFLFIFFKYLSFYQRFWQEIALLVFIALVLFRQFTICAFFWSGFYTDSQPINLRNNNTIYTNAVFF
jgi:hypothetical protein